MATWIVPEVQRVPTRKGYFPPDDRIEPLETIVIHYTAGRDAPLRPRVESWAGAPVDVNDASTHLVTSRRPVEQPTLQLAPLDARTWHAGGSILNGRGGVNRRSVGIDFDNLGYLRRAPGGIIDAAGRPYKGPAPFIAENGELWEPYTEPAIVEVCRLVLMICDLFPQFQNNPSAIVGHENIKSTKRDPGRAFDQFWPIVREVTFGRFPTGLTAV